MTANDAQPMSQKQADALRREWALLLKMGYASQWTPVQKMARQDEIAALLLQAGQALPRALTRQEVLASVPICNAEGGRYYVSVRQSHLDRLHDAVVAPQMAGDQRCGSSSSIRLAGWVGKRSSTSLRYA